MSIRALVFILYTIVFAYEFFLQVVSLRSSRNPIPESVKDVYSAESYAKWSAYHSEKLKNGMAAKIAAFVVGMIMLATDSYAWAASLAGDSLIGGIACVLLYSQVVETLTGLFFSWRDDMVIEQKYGFNRMTKKTFIADQVKGIVVSLIIMGLLVWLLAVIHRALGDWVIVLFSGVLMVFLLCVSFLYPVFSKLFNKFTDLEEGELRERLTALLEKNGYKVRGIKVMDASKRSTKSNAYFSGFGRMKTIVLYDTLLSSMETDEICAVFAHEMGHGLNRDTTKNQILSFINVLMLAVTIWLTLRTEALYTAFGFESINYAFAVIIATVTGFSIVSPAFGLITSWYSRRAEYRADAQAVREGYGETLISALKKLTRDDFGNPAPSKLLVKLEYSHPPLAERIEAIRKRENGV